MNTLNDALTPVIVWLENGCDPKHAAAELRLIRESANTPESSAAQGAMGRTELHTMGDGTRRAYYFATPEMYIDVEEDEHGKFSIFTKDRVAGSECFVEVQPSDATAQPSATIDEALGKAIEQTCNVIREAGKNEYSKDELDDICNQVYLMFGRAVPQIAAQPRVDLTDEQIINIAKACAEIDSRGNESFMHYEAPLILNFARALLANTAQGKPDHVPDATKMICDAERYQFVRNSGNVETYIHNQPGIDNCKQIAGDGLDAAIDTALAAKKGESWQR